MSKPLDAQGPMMGGEGKHDFVPTPSGHVRRPPVKIFVHDSAMPLSIVKFCAGEVYRQYMSHPVEESPLAVWWMVEAWNTARLLWATTSSADRSKAITPGILGVWGTLVHPVKNLHGLRGPRENVAIVTALGDVRHLGTDGRDVGREIEDLCREIAEGAIHVPKRSQSRMLELIKPEHDTLASMAYLKFQLIHPFKDGNGRTGKILYNWLRGTLEEPQMPPNFFNCANP